MKLSPLVLMLLLACTTLAFGESPRPKTLLKDALAKAEKYVKDQKLDAPGFLPSAVYRSKNPVTKTDCWVVMWSTDDENVFDGDMYIFVDDDGRITRADDA